MAVYNYRTGDVLCMVSSPTFDPADPPEIRDGDSRYDGVYLNRVLSSTFAPGSVFKLVTTAAALEQLDGTLDRHFTCTGRLELEGGVIPTGRWTCTTPWPGPATAPMPRWRWSWGAIPWPNTRKRPG